jgi:drug/metabolite transporter (DMT)-like permease
MILYTAVFASVLAYLFWNRAVQLGGANLAGIMFNLTPVFVVIFAVALLGERPSWYQGAGLALIFLGIYLAVIRARPAARPASGRAA